MAKISVIVPVYNVEKYLAECLDSIINQTFKDIEIICVNDGSKDNSAQILEEYAQKDSRIRIITKENGGLSSARNEGLKYATADYISFVDSDDWLSFDFYEKAYKKITEEDCDFCQINFSFVQDKKNVVTKTVYDFSAFYKNKNNDKAFNYKDEPDFVLSGSYGAPLKLYKKDFFFEHIKSFPIGKWYEDVVPGVTAVVAAKKICFIEEGLYFYRDNQNSITSSTANNPKALDILDAIKGVENVFLKYGVFEFLEPRFYKFVFTSMSNYSIAIKNKQIRQEFIKRSKEYLADKNIKMILKKYKYLKNFYPEFMNCKLYNFLKRLFSINYSNNRDQIILYILFIRITRKIKKKREN